jgi:hypothetical protein
MKSPEKNFRFLLPAALALLVTVPACTPPAAPPEEVPTVSQTSPDALNPVAEEYVKLVLALGEHDADYVDAYHGPAEWRDAAKAAAKPLDAIRAEAEALANRIPEPGTATEKAVADEAVALRHSYLRAQLRSVAARARLLAGEAMSFDEESEALYNAVSPRFGDEYFRKVLSELDALLTEDGFQDGTFLDRYDAFRSQFVIPAEKLDEVFRTAVDACRERTVQYVPLPADESFTIEYVQDKSWSGYNWYQGEYRSLIQVNTDLPIYVDRALDLACHEGYPGHHVYNMLLEKHLVKDRGWVELQVYPLFSPQSLIAEGSANFGIEMAFPGAERLAYERDVLYPLAGLDPAKAASYDAMRQLLERLTYSSNEIGRRLLDGEVDDAGAAEWFEKYAAMPRARAEQRVRFIRQYRAYVINYNVGQDLVRDWVDAQAAPDTMSQDAVSQDAVEARWRAFGQLLSSPRLPGDLRIPETP